MEDDGSEDAKLQKYMLMTSSEDEPEKFTGKQTLDPITTFRLANAVISGVAMFGSQAEQISRYINTDRNVTIKINNKSNTYALTNPSNYTSYGHCYHPPQPTIDRNVHDMCSFSKNEKSPHGTSGVLMYQILNKKKGHVGELAIMFCVPFNYMWNKNKFAVGIYEPNTPCDDKLYEKMKSGSRKCKNQDGTGNSITHCDIGAKVQLKGTMSSCGHAEIKVEMWDM